MFWMRNKENSFPICTFIWRPAVAQLRWESVRNINLHYTVSRYHLLLLQVLFGQQELYPKRLFSSGMCPCQWKMGTVAGKGLKLWPSSEGVGRHIVFCVDPVGDGFSVSIAFCLLSILWTVGWNLTKPAHILTWDSWKKWLDFGYLNIVFKVIRFCYMTPLNYVLWLAETSSHWLWQVLMSNSDCLCQCWQRAKNRLN